MPDSDPNKRLSGEQFYAQGVLNAVRDVVDAFAAHGEVSALRRIVAGDEEFRGGLVGQLPERFTEDELIRPILETLGYTEIISQPADLVRDQRSVPDFKAGGVAASCVCIVEAKRLGRLNQLDRTDEPPDIEEEVMKYLGENALTKYKRDLDTQYLMGLGTDGVTWLLYGKDLDTGEQTWIHSASLQEPIRQAVLARQYEDGTGDSWVTEQRPYVQEEFVPLFTADAASEAVIAELRG